MTEALPIADAWFRSEEISEGVTLFVEPFIDRLLESNAWHVRGRDADLLVDAANGVGSLLPFVAPLAQGRPIIAVATHGHFDHTGGLHEFEDRRCHADDADDVRQPFPLRLLHEHFAEGTDEMFEFYGYPVPEVAVTAVPAAGFDLEAWVTPGAEPTTFLTEGDIVDLGDRSFEVMHVPGHTAGSIALWDPAAGTLFTGDAAYVGDLLSWDDEETFRASITRLAEVPASQVCAGHGPVFGGEELRTLAATLREG
ncbi:MAG: MBL fold metallo-hydrolase [Actinobacteria bacterium]|nr:MBL fold metallo-hydrolase [Actinomycetota bacterium]